MVHENEGQLSLFSDLQTPSESCAKGLETRKGVVATRSPVE